ncbi:nucleotide pyrophosphohydrolase [Dolosigranulum pigrum]|uniref:nucleotide pyrophosphohydrolase n=1 Tax=Dolosigranulum pigrum TaxID=29394 RepID=UPI001AD886E8|nr:nucleotide pyrophosphohydrolase [Dolosigranulum pigrum]QTJ34490.1 nucleotide pyrophosphohydrolase [Dolosigranulum pigrum]QTJ39670.1 nucleotide pyrophosphohydrolase [Dolosigranulum pigrum]QTJ48160.1 nucleotide pyrophosphohydrolase [Dolosigranulum pigrum]
MKQSTIELIKQFHKERNWEQHHNLKDLSLSLTLEATELLELFQWKNPEEAAKEHYQDMKDELADILIYAITIANKLDADLDTIIVEKMKKNAQKYPVND